MDRQSAVRHMNDGDLTPSDQAAKRARGDGEEAGGLSERDELAIRLGVGRSCHGGDSSVGCALCASDPSDDGFAGFAAATANPANRPANLSVASPDSRETCEAAVLA